VQPLQTFEEQIIEEHFDRVAGEEDWALCG
jgi:hypothetical protein